MSRVPAEVGGSIKNVVSNKKPGLVRRVLDRLYQQFVYIPRQRKLIREARNLHFLATKSASVFKLKDDEKSFTFDIRPSGSRKKTGNIRFPLFNAKGKKRYLQVPVDCGIESVTVQVKKPEVK